MCSAESRAEPILLELMTTVGCHLCDQAVELIIEVLNGQCFTVELVDIAFENDLMERYATSIPVLVCVDKKKELAWPFDARQLSDFAHDLLSKTRTPS